LQLKATSRSAGQVVQLGSMLVVGFGVMIAVLKFLLS